MKSKTKYLLNREQIARIFAKAGLGYMDNYYQMGAGEFNSIYCVKVKEQEYVLKIAPRVDKSVLTYEKDMLKSEITWYNRIADGTNIRVPKVYYSDFSKEIIDAPYFIMDKLNSVQAGKIGIDSTDKLAQMASQIHKITNEKFGYEQNALYDDWYLAIRSMTENLIKDAKAKGHRSKRGERLLQYIDKFKDILIEAPCCMVNFDLWSPNVICEKDEDESYKYAFIDPERTYWGDFVADFVALEYGKNLEDKKIAIEAYNAVAETPLVVDNKIKVRYYVAEAYLALIVEVEKYYRYSIFHLGWYKNISNAKFLFNHAFNFLQNFLTSF